ncbi:MAG TPA: hypothetical protein VIU64_09605 [Polyangia bacterium]
MALRNSDKIPPRYSYRAQIARTAALATVLLVIAIAIGRHASGAAWLLLPAVWVFANFFEWTVHRFPMHRALVPRIMYRNHAQIHHTAFTDEAMAIGEPRELWLIMMPWYTIVMLLVAASPVAIALALVGGLPLAGIFYVGALSYFLFYEAVHAAYHLPPATLERLGLGEGTLFARLRAHHAHHHALRRMAHVNFNVTIPLADTVLGTRERPEPHDAAAGARPSPSRT